MLVFWYETIVNCKANINNWFTNFARNSSEPSIATASRKMQNFKYWFELCHQITVQCALCMPINISNESFNRACHRMGKFKFKLKLSERFSLCHLLWNEAYHYSIDLSKKNSYSMIQIVRNDHSCSQLYHFRTVDDISFFFLLKWKKTHLSNKRAHRFRWSLFLFFEDSK